MKGVPLFGLGLLSFLALVVSGQVEKSFATSDPPPASLQETPEQRATRMRWWREAKFGLFLHWGVYAVPAGAWGGRTDYGEWLMHSAKIPVAEYRALARRFNPVGYDPEAWVRLARRAGMRYMVITAKHHDGFALFPSDVTDWDIADATPYRKDLLGPLVTAAHRAGLKIGFYYSQAQDWVHPGGAKAHFEEGDGWDAAHKGDFDAYLRTVALPQVRELLSRYPIDILWWDTAQHMTPERAAPFAALTALRPGLITNNRFGRGYRGDFATPEQFVPVTGYAGDWETCMTMNDHWGYNAADQNWKSATELIRKLAEVASKGGNFLLNIGPTAEGRWPEPAVERLEIIGRWMRRHGEAIYGTVASPFAHLSWGVAIRRGNRLYLHVFEWPSDARLRVPLRSRVKSARLLGGSRRLALSREAERVIVSLPARPPDPHGSVVVLELDGEPQVPPLPSAGATASASAWASNTPPANALDGSAGRVWRAPPEVKSACLEVDLGRFCELSGLGFDEPDVWPRMRQRYRLEVLSDDAWRLVAEGKTVGHGAVRHFPVVRTRRVRLTVENDQGAPGVAELQLYSPE